MECDPATYTCVKGSYNTHNLTLIFRHSHLSFTAFISSCKYVCIVHMHVVRVTARNYNPCSSVSRDVSLILESSITRLDIIYTFNSRISHLRTPKNRSATRFTRTNLDLRTPIFTHRIHRMLYKLIRLSSTLDTSLSPLFLYSCTLSRGYTGFFSIFP